jgi:predicted metal-dependent hydrolase
MNIRIHYGDEQALCEVRESPSLTGRIRVHVYPDGDVEIEAPPGKAVEEIQAAAQKRARWVFRHRRTAKEARENSLPREYVSGETHFYLGRRYKLIVLASRQETSSVKLMRGRLEVRVRTDDPAAVRRRLRLWYHERADEYFQRKVSEWAAVLPWVNANPEFKLVRMSTQWGSCSPHGTINLNPALIKAPRHCIEYVILHELCHLQEHNHSQRFYGLLDRHMPGWQAAKAELDGLAELLLAGN